MAQGLQSPAAAPRPKPANIEIYPAKQVRTGELRFVSQCGFCHGRDAAGGESGPDLTRSELVAADTGGDKIGPLLSAGRPDAGMPCFHIKDEELKAIAAFIHTQANKFAALGGGRRSVDPSTPSPSDSGAGWHPARGWQPRSSDRRRSLISLKTPPEEQSEEPITECGKRSRNLLPAWPSRPSQPSPRQSHPSKWPPSNRPSPWTRPKCWLQCKAVGRCPSEQISAPAGPNNFT